MCKVLLNLPQCKIDQHNKIVALCFRPNSIVALAFGLSKTTTCISTIKRAKALEAVDWKEGCHVARMA